MNNNNNKINGYIYVRTHESYDLYNACKLGKTINIPNRDNTYITGEINRGIFLLVFKFNVLSNKQLSYIENLLKYQFNNYNIKYNGGTEFYDKIIINLIEPYLIELELEYIKLSSSEINQLNRSYRAKNKIKSLNKQNFINALYKTYNEIDDNEDNNNKDNEDNYDNEDNEDNYDNDDDNNNNDNDNDNDNNNNDDNNKNKEIIVYTPRDYQINIINKSIEYFKKNSKGLLILMCGVGKTLISLWIAKELNSKKIIIGVPNLLLVNQWKKYIENLFPNTKYLEINGNVKKNKISTFLKTNNNNCIIITTYASSYKVNEMAKKNNFKFDLKIQDEVHHLTATNRNIKEESIKYINMLEIPCEKQLSLTATIKQLDNINFKKEDIISNDNIEDFGEIIDKKSLIWAIDKNIICDYAIQSIVTNEENLKDKLEKFNITNEDDKRLFLSAYISLKSIYENHSHHLFIYSNNKDNSNKIIQYIKLLLDNKYFDLPDLYYSSYHSEIQSEKQDEIVNNFKTKKNGIISCVYCLGEGFDCPILDGVVFSENMSSNIRIVQSALRASRKNNLEPDKITKIILPILNINNNNDWINNDNTDFKKIREIIYQLSLEDKTIEHKIKVLILDTKLQNKNNINNNINNVNNFGDYDDELTKQLKLNTTKRISLGISYEQAKKIILNYKIKSKEEYYKLCENDIRLSNEPEEIYKNKFINWIDYLGIKREYYDLETCKKKVNEYLTLYPEIKNNLNLSFICNKLCDLDNKFPPEKLWTDYYNVKKLEDIIIITNKKKMNLFI